MQAVNFKIMFFFLMRKTNKSVILVKVFIFHVSDKEASTRNRNQYGELLTSASSVLQSFVKVPETQRTIFLTGKLNFFSVDSTSLITGQNTDVSIVVVCE